ncbi:MAG TPA: hypothetical protein VGO34_15160 [Alphaproteobacteria bacterium]|jgi:hypothetical protein
MKASISTVCLFVLATAVTGCGTSTRVLNSNPESVSIVFDGDESTMADVNRLATAECQKGARMAALRDIAPVKDGRVANYDCKKP